MMHDISYKPASADLFTQEAIYTARIKLDALTKKEVLVLHYLVSGISTKLIAYRLGVASKTIQKHRSSIMKKTGIRSLSALTILFYMGIKDCSAVCLLIRRCTLGDNNCPIRQCLGDLNPKNSNVTREKNRMNFPE